MAEISKSARAKIPAASVFSSFLPDLCMELTTFHKVHQKAHQEQSLISDK